MLYGKYVNNGTIDLQTTIGELEIDEKDGLLPKEKTATINDLITSRSVYIMWLQMEVTTKKIF